MKEIRTKMKKEMITAKKFTDEFATAYQYQMAYANELINNLELFGRIMTNEANYEENMDWFAMFYIRTEKNKLHVIPSISDEDIKRDYKIYREFVLSELKRVKPLIDMHYFSMLGAVKDLDTTRKKIDTYKLV